MQEYNINNLPQELQEQIISYCDWGSSRLVNKLFKPKGYILYYQIPNLLLEITSKYFYQLTLSDQLWLKNAQRYGHYCIGVDSKYDLNNDHVHWPTINYRIFLLFIEFIWKIQNFIHM